ncbi:MAG TPA: hypothetical protein VHH12_05795 [Mycobacterium sp.]|nr:hypothetical protein [Mycobacterium sp.]
MATAGRRHRYVMSVVVSCAVPALLAGAVALVEIAVTADDEAAPPPRAASSVLDADAWRIALEE